MKNIVWNVLAVIVGFVIGMIVNGALIELGPRVIPLPPGVDMTTMAGVKAAMPLLKPENFVFPFLAHALGTFVASFVGALLAASYRMKIAIGLGVLSLLGGIAAVMMLPTAPLWFDALDLLAAYIPMAWIAGTIAKGMRREQVSTQMA